LCYSTLTDNKSSLKINVKDKDDCLGQIIIPLSDIPSDEHFLKWVPLGPHKKNSNPHGEVCLDCWIEDFYEDNEETAHPSPSAQNKTGKFFRKNLSKLTGRSPEANRKNLSPFSDSYGPGVTSIKGSVSMEDLSSKSNKTSPSFNNKYNNKKDSLLAPAAYTNIRKSVSTLALNSTPKSSSTILTTPQRQSTTPDETAGVSLRRNSINDIVAASNAGGAGATALPTIKEQCYPPKILNMVPNLGPADGGTLIQITGKYLGNSKDDITRLMVAGCNCLASVEYYSSSKIICTTTESIGKGPITLSTRSGGMSSSKMMFEFVEGAVEKSTENNNGPIGKSPFFSFRLIFSDNSR